MRRPRLLLTCMCHVSYCNISYRVYGKTHIHIPSLSWKSHKCLVAWRMTGAQETKRLKIKPKCRDGNKSSTSLNSSPRFRHIKPCVSGHMNESHMITHHIYWMLKKKPNPTNVPWRRHIYIVKLRRLLIHISVLDNINESWLSHQHPMTADCHP